ncbi:FepA family TonB-dependent siderophore receptor [Lonepinella sp. BR2271]|uniref:FepA family TonB-dependent siderophore receptor n=1 Tax=Lonepinella sp. BR2271 TaxID=3434550 RepID=UPI003F6DC0BD
MSKLALSAISLALFSAYATAETQQLDVISVVAQDPVHSATASQAQQSLGKTTVSSQAIEKQPAVNDIADILRHQPGVTYNSGSATGQYGNKRQIDLRGMGTENTLILIDGKPATSRQSARYGRNNGRNTLGDSKWVPIEEIESVEVIRGTEAARYGNGAMGGVVNIKTKPVTDKLKGSITYNLNVPENSQYGTSNRATFNLSGPIIQDVLGFRLYGSWNKTRADAIDTNNVTVTTGINRRTREPVVTTTHYPAREGVRNKDIAGRLSWKITPEQVLTLDASYSRQGNIYAGGDIESDSISTDAADITTELPYQGAETNRVYRQVYALTHEGKWSWGENKTYVQFDKTVNSRFPVYLGFGTEGTWENQNFVDSKLTNYRFNHEMIIPFSWYGDHKFTVGVDANHSKLNDPDSTSYSFSRDGTNGMNLGYISWLADGDRSGTNSVNEYGLFIEDVIDFKQGTIVTPMVRFDYHSVSKSNWSPSLNISHDLNPYLTIKGGLARAYKAPNLYQSNPNYVLANRQNNCPVNGRSLDEVGSCYTVGNKDLKPETSFNKEIGFELHNQDGHKLGLTYYHNAYRNKIEADTNVLATTTNESGRAFMLDGRTPITSTDIYKWDNIPRATVEGLEGYLNLPLVADKLDLATNFTYIRKSINKSTGNPLSLMPKYTISSTLTYQATDNLDFATTYTRYGKQLSRPNAVRYMHYTINPVVQERLGSYGVWGASVGYKWGDFSVRAGVSNILNKRIYVTNSAASKSNEIGRAYYTTLKYSF